MMFRRVAAVAVTSVVCLMGWAGTASAATTPPSPITEISITTDTYDLADKLISSETLPPTAVNTGIGIQGSGGFAYGVKSFSGCRDQTFTVTRKSLGIAVFTINKRKRYCWSSNRVYGPNGVGSEPALSFWVSYTLGQTQVLDWRWAHNYFYNYSGLGANSGHDSQLWVQMKTCGGPICFTEFPYIRVDVHGDGTWLMQWYDGD